MTRNNELASSPHRGDDDGIMEQTDTINPDDDNEPFAGI